MATGTEASHPNGEETGASAPGLTQWSPTSTAEERRNFYQRRLALFTKLFFWTFVILLIWVNVMYFVQPVLRPTRYLFNNYVGIAGVVSLGLLWRLVLVRRPISQSALFALDITIAEVIGIALGLAAAASWDKPANVASMLVWALLMVFARVTIIPSRGTRTLLISAGALAPQVAAATYIVFIVDEKLYWGTPKIAFAVAAAIYVTVAAMLAGLGSQVLYGLRKRVAEAQQLGQYTLTKKIGEGGMGTVYKARHAMLRRPTALKLLSPEQTGDKSLARFEREVQLTSELTHPNTIAIYDYGRSPEGVFYYAMEYLEGIDLERLVHRHGPQPPGRVIHILAQVCGALDEAHDRGLIHRDVKPANIILCWRGKIPDVAKVLDFGLVKHIQDPAGTSTKDAIAGTPGYLAPETIVSANQIGPAGDIYAVGAVAFYLLTGRVVFPSSTTVEMCVHHVNTPPDAPGKYAPGLPAELDELVLDCLAKNPEDRPESAEALRERLLALPSADWDQKRAEAWWADNPLEPESDEAPQTATMTVELAGRVAERIKRARTLLGI